MTSVEQYGYANNRPDEYRTEEQQSNLSESPEKLFHNIESGKKEIPPNKENFTLSPKPIMQRDPRTMKGLDTSPAGKVPGLQLRDSNAGLRDRTNYAPSIEARGGLAHSQTFGESIDQSPISAQPISNSEIRRVSTFSRASSQVFQLHRNDITISVTDPERRGDMFGKHTYLSVHGSDNEGEFKVTRSHEDFIKIRNLLVKRWPGCYIPSIPPKRVLTKMVPMFLEGRRKEFEMFVQKITELPHLHYSREYQRFLRSNNLDEDLATFQKINYDDIILKYKTVFKHQLQQGANNTQLERKIDDFKIFLQRIHGQFKGFKKVLKKTAATRQAYYEQLTVFHDIMSKGYEKSVLTKMDTSDGSKRVFDESEEVNERASGIKLASQQHSIEYLHAWVKAENREISAFLEAIEQKDVYSNKERKASATWVSSVDKLQRTVNGKPGFLAAFSGKSRDEQISILQGKIAVQDKEAKQLKILYEMILSIVANSEIDRFRERKSEQYHHVVNLAAQYELSNLTNLVEYWSTIVNAGPARSITQSNISH